MTDLLLCRHIVVHPLNCVRTFCVMCFNCSTILSLVWCAITRLLCHKCVHFTTLLKLRFTHFIYLNTITNSILFSFKKQYGSIFPHFELAYIKNIVFLIDSSNGKGQIELEIMIVPQFWRQCSTCSTSRQFIFDRSTTHRTYVLFAAIFKPRDMLIRKKVAFFRRWSYKVSLEHVSRCLLRINPPLGPLVFPRSRKLIFPL